MTRTFIGAVKQHIQRLPLAWFFPIYCLWFWLDTGRSADRLRKRLGIPLLSGTDLFAAKTSDTVFILGSGRSINEITAAQWEVIKSHDTIALNNWPVHPFVPTFYCYESAVNEPGLDEAYNFLLNNICNRASDYRPTIKIIANFKRAERPQIGKDLTHECKHNLYFVYTPVVIARTPEEFRAMVRFYRRLGLFAISPKIRNLFKYSSVLSTCLSLAIRLGYRKIVLCGVDLKTSEYFYQDSEQFPRTSSVSLRPRDETHDTAIAKPWLVPMDEMLSIIREEILEPAGVELLVASTHSLLHPRIPSAQSLFAVLRQEKHPPGKFVSVSGEAGLSGNSDRVSV